MVTTANRSRGSGRTNSQSAPDVALPCTSRTGSPLPDTRYAIRVPSADATYSTAATRETLSELRLLLLRVRTRTFCHLDARRSCVLREALARGRAPRWRHGGPPSVARYCVGDVAAAG